mgnify:CR=1 FL=1
MVAKILFFINTCVDLFFIVVLILIKNGVHMYGLRDWLFENGGFSVYINLLSMVMVLFFKPKTEKKYFYLTFVSAIAGITMYILSYPFFQPWWPSEISSPTRYATDCQYLPLKHAAHPYRVTAPPNQHSTSLRSLLPIWSVVLPTVNTYRKNACMIAIATVLRGESIVSCVDFPYL